MKKKVLCTTRIVRKQRDANIAVENIESGKRNCPAFGKRCSACGIMNHFASQCMAKANVNMVERESGSDNEYCLTLESLDESKILRVHLASDHEYAKKLFALEI